MTLAEDPLPPRSDLSPAPLGAPRRVRLRTLVLLRWLAIAGQTGALAFVRFGLGFDVALAPAFAVVGVSAAVNLFLMLSRPSQKLVGEWEAALQLAFDVLQLAALLALTGGIQNPFLLLFIAPVAVAASALRPSTTAGLAAIAFVCVGVLALWHAPLPWRAGETLELPPLYQAGLGGAVLIGLAFTSVYAWRVAAEEERLSMALTAVQTVLAREQRVAALGGLAAAAAHELGTPLATIQLVAKEMARALPPDSPHAEDAQLLVSQAERCRGILRQLSQRPETGDAVMARQPLMALLEEAAGPHRGLGPTVTLQIKGPAGDAGPGPELQRLPEALHGLGNLIENAVGFAVSAVEVTGAWSATQVAVTVADDGPGFPASVLARLGEPYVSQRGPSDPAGGLGLGFFIAKTLLERTGAQIEPRNRPLPAQGAVVTVTWPRRRIEAPARA